MRYGKTDCVIRLFDSLLISIFSGFIYIMPIALDTFLVDGQFNVILMDFDYQ